MTVDIRDLDKEIELNIDNMSDEEIEKELKEPTDKEVEDKDPIHEEKKEEPVVKPEEKKEEEKPKEENKEKPTQEDIDYREKFVSSQKEALRLREENQKLQEEKEELTKKKEVTDEELKATYYDWEEMTEREQQFARESENQKLRLKALEARNQIYLNEKKFVKEIDDQLGIWDATGEFKSITRHQEEFKKFARKDGNKGLALDVLAKLFMYEIPKDVQPKGGTPLPKSTVKHTESTEGKSSMSVEDVALLRKTKPMEYMQRAANGEFDNVF